METKAASKSKFQKENSKLEEVWIGSDGRFDINFKQRKREVKADRKKEQEVGSIYKPD